jgi:hypothetical protein
MSMFVIIYVGPNSINVLYFVAATYDKPQLTMRRDRPPRSILRYIYSTSTNHDLSKIDFFFNFFHGISKWGGMETTTTTSRFDFIIIEYLFSPWNNKFKNWFYGRFSSHLFLLLSVNSLTKHNLWNVLWMTNIQPFLFMPNVCECD